MEAKELDGLLKGIARHFRMEYHPDAVDQVWQQLMAYPVEAALAVSAILSVERHAVPSQAPTLGQLDRLLRDEMARIDRRRQQSEDDDERRKRDPVHVARKRNQWLRSFGPYERARLRLLQSIAWGTGQTRQQIRDGLVEIMRQFPEREAEINAELAGYDAGTVP